MPRFGHSLPKEKLGGIGMPSWLPDWLTGKDVREIQGPVYIPPRGKAGGHRKELAADIARQAKDPFTQRDIYSAVQAGADVVPLMGEDVGVKETGEYWKKGDYINAAASGLGTVLGVAPVVGDVGGKLVKEGGKKLAKGLGGPSKELDEIIAAGEAAAAQPKGLGSKLTETGWTFRDVEHPHPLMERNDWRTFNRAAETGEGIMDVELPIRSMYAAQKEVNPDFAKVPSAYAAGDPKAKPMVIKKGGKYFVTDGHHRLVAAAEQGQQTANVRLLDLDQTTQTEFPLLDWKAPNIEKTAAAVVDPVAPQGLGAPATQKPRSAAEPEFSHPVSGAPYNRLTRPLGEMTSTVEPMVDILRREIAPEELYDKVFIGALGDRTAAGGRLTSVDGTELKNPVTLGGGPDYMGGAEQQNPDRLIWKSGDTVIENYADAVRRAREAHPGKDVVIGNILMGEQAGDFSDQMTRTVIEKMRDANMTAADLSALDAAINVRIARDAPKSPPWPGFKAIHKDPEMLEQWLRSAGSGRTQIPAELEMVRWSGKLPRDIIASSRKAITEPRFLNEKTGLGGHVLGIADPEGRVVKQPLVSRADYPTGLGGTFFGNLPEGIPHHILLHDYVTNMRAKGTKSGGPVTTQHELYGIERAKPFQLIDEPQLKRLMTYLSSGKGIKLGLGGALAAGLLTEPQAEELKEKLGA